MPSDDKQFDFETIAVVLCAMLESGQNLGAKHYAMMSAIDSKGRTASSFEHQFRGVKARAKQLQEQAKNGELATPAKSKPKASKGTTPGSRSTKRPRKSKAEMESDEQDDEESPSKKVKSETSGEDEEGDMV